MSTQQHQRVDDNEFARRLMASIERSALATFDAMRSQGMLAESSSDEPTVIQVAVPLQVHVRAGGAGERQREICCTCQWEGDVWVCRGAGTGPCCPDF